MYDAFLPPPLVAQLNEAAQPVPDVDGLRVTAGLTAEFPELENAEIHSIMVEVYRAVRADLSAILEQRQRDRAFVDAVLAADPKAEIIGMTDAQGRVVIGPLANRQAPEPVSVPAHLSGPQVTLFGPPDSEKMSINAMNALHRRLPNESPLVAELVQRSGHVPRWGADSEDSKTPIASDLRRATMNLRGCIDRTLQFTDPNNSRQYALHDDKLSIPIKRIPGLALPDADHFLDGEVLPLHVVELVGHLWTFRDMPSARVLYVPKLENEEEAAYLATLIRTTEESIAQRYPPFLRNQTRIILVFENPRAIFRIQEMALALSPFFLGGSLGWHDFLASTARLFRHDPDYRIPVKADPNIVIRNIRESHAILVDELSTCGALKIGGMYGVLYQSGDVRSFSVCMVGYIRDVITQLKRGLDGFWVAHPDFVRIGIALVQAYHEQQDNPEQRILHRLVCALVPEQSAHQALIDFIDGPDVPRLPSTDSRYLRSVLAANHGVSSVIANDDPEEVRYNVFQALQYLADWLCGNGCVALPATMNDSEGQPVFVRIMDDLATTERSRWEVWAEVAHGRVSTDTFEQILSEEVAFLRAGQDSAHRRIQVRWEGEAARWYPLAVTLLRQLVLDPTPCEFVTELLMPFTLPCIRQAPDPLSHAMALCPGRYRVEQG